MATGDPHVHSLTTCGAVDLPAIIRAVNPCDCAPSLNVLSLDGTREWYLHNKKHRSNNCPAVVYADGRQEWWIHGKQEK